MTLLSKILSLGVLAGGFLSVAACQEGTSRQPNPKTLPLTIKVTGPEGIRERDSVTGEWHFRKFPKGWHQGDSASFRKIMNGEMDPKPFTWQSPQVSIPCNFSLQKSLCAGWRQGVGTGMYPAAESVSVMKVSYIC